jgi:hypothetical protein
VTTSTFARAARAFDRTLRALGVGVHKPLATPRCAHFEVRSQAELRDAVAGLSAGQRTSPVVLSQALRELVALNTPALLLNIVQPKPRVRVSLRPWAGGSIRFRGRSYFIDAGSEATEGIEAFLATPFAHTTTLYPSAPDHPVHVISIEHPGEVFITGDVPPWLTHFTLLINEVVWARAEPVLHERGTQIWAA